MIEILCCKVLEELQKDPWPVPADQRAVRCTSTALSVAASLLGACVPGSGARIMAFIGGPSTEGPAAVSFASFLVVLQKLSFPFLGWLVFAPLPFLFSFLCIHPVYSGAWPCFVNILFSLFIKKKKKVLRTSGSC